MKYLSNLKDKYLRKDVPKAIRVQRKVAIAVMAVILGAFLFAYIRYGDALYNTFCKKENLEAFLAQFNGLDRVIFVAIRAFQTVIKIIPAEPLEIAAGAFYGVVPGMLYCLLGSTIGSLVIVFITKLVGRKVIDLFVPIEVIDDFALFKDKKRMYTGIFMIYIIPSTPKDLLVYAAALTDISIWKFMLLTTVARIPNIIISTWCGAELINENYALAIGIFIASAVLAVGLSLIYKAITKKRKSKEG